MTSVQVLSTNAKSLLCVLHVLWGVGGSIPIINSRERERERTLGMAVRCEFETVGICRLIEDNHYDCGS